MVSKDKLFAFVMDHEQGRIIQYVIPDGLVDNVQDSYEGHNAVMDVLRKKHSVGDDGNIMLSSYSDVILESSLVAVCVSNYDAAVSLCKSYSSKVDVDRAVNVLRVVLNTASVNDLDERMAALGYVHKSKCEVSSGNSVVVYQPDYDESYFIDDSDPDNGEAPQ